MDKNKYWERYKEYYYYNKDLGLGLDISRMNFADDFITSMEPRMQRAYQEMAELEAGGVANPDEKRMVGHYWLRNSDLAPDPEISREIEENITAIKQFAVFVHQGKIRSGSERVFKNFLLIGIGGSALGPQLVADALKTGNNLMKPHYLDNTDPDGIDRVREEIGDELDETLVLVISKSGGTVETHNGMLEIKNYFQSKGLIFASNAVAITMANSKLDRLARKEGWLARFPLWDWVGGRTSVTSSVGLLPAALQGIDIDSFLEGARACDLITRQPQTRSNPAAMLALMWYYGSGGRGNRDMVILPYKDRLQYLARYLQQLIMESLGKELNRDGQPVYQGLTVYGNKGSTDQHAYVQQLLDGVNNFFVTFIEVLADRRKKNFYVKENMTSGDYLRAFLLGTRQAMTEKGRESMTIILEKIDAYSLGVLLALFERTVTVYAGLVNINAYHQPGVELGKKGANMVIDMLAKTLDYLNDKRGAACKIEDIAVAVGYPGETEILYKILEFLILDKERGIKKMENGDLWNSGYYVE